MLRPQVKRCNCRCEGASMTARQKPALASLCRHVPVADQGTTLSPRHGPVRRQLSPAATSCEQDPGCCRENTRVLHSMGTGSYPWLLQDARGIRSRTRPAALNPGARTLQRAVLARLHLERVVFIRTAAPHPLPGTGKEVSREKKRAPALALAHMRVLVGPQAIQVLGAGAEHHMAKGDGHEGQTPWPLFSASGPSGPGQCHFQHTIDTAPAGPRQHTQQGQKEADQGGGRGPEQAPDSPRTRSQAAPAHRGLGAG